MFLLMLSAKCLTPSPESEDEDEDDDASIPNEFNADSAEFPGIREGC